MGMNALGIGFLLAFLGTLLSLTIFPKIGFLDFPERYGFNRAKLPYPGGIVLWVLSFGLFYIHQEFLILSVPLFVLGIVSFWDDRKNISPFLRLSVHVLLALFLCMAGIKIHVIGNPFSGTNFEISRVFPAIAVGLTIFWVVAIQNAMNWFDGAPGLSVGTAGIGFLTLGILGGVRPELFFDSTHAPLTMAHFYLAGLCFGAFWFYFRQKIVLGDTGSQVLGFLLAVMAIFSGAKIATTLLVLSLPILDFFWVIFRRTVLENKSPFRGDTRHLHHNLNHYFSQKNTTLVLLCLSAMAGGISLLLTGYEKMIAFFGVVVLILGVNFWIWYKTGTSN